MNHSSLLSKLFLLRQEVEIDGRHQPYGRKWFEGQQTGLELGVSRKGVSC
jgi:hypothetical protein